MRMVLEQLFHHESASRTDSRIGAPGKAWLLFPPKRSPPDGQSSAASYPSKKAF
jgi:hypothetical protein